MFYQNEFCAFIGAWNYHWESLHVLPVGQRPHQWKFKHAWENQHVWKKYLCFLFQYLGVHVCTLAFNYGKISNVVMTHYLQTPVWRGSHVVQNGARFFKHVEIAVCCVMHITYGAQPFGEIIFWSYLWVFDTDLFHIFKDCIGHINFSSCACLVNRQHQQIVQLIVNMGGSKRNSGEGHSTHRWLKNKFVDGIATSSSKHTKNPETPKDFQGLNNPRYFLDFALPSSKKLWTRNL